MWAYSFFSSSNLDGWDILDKVSITQQYCAVYQSIKLV